MTRKLIFLLVLALALSACNVPQPTPDAVGTIVAATLTSAAPATAVPNINQLIGATATPAPVLPTASPVPGQPQPSPIVILVTATPQAPVPAPTANITGDEPALRQNRPSFIEGFENPSSGWNYEDDYFHLTPQNNVLTLRSKGTPWWNSWFSTRPFFQDGYVEVNFKLENCQGDDRVGLSLRVVDNQFYFMGLTCKGTWGFDRYTSEHRIVNIRAYESSTALGEGWNRIGVLAEGDNFSFYINGVKVGEAQDASYRHEGRFGFISRASSTNPFLTLADDLGYWALP